MIKDILNRRNRHKRVIARTPNGVTITEALDRITADNVVHFRYAIARTDASGNAFTDDGIVLSPEELTALADAIQSAPVRKTATLNEYNSSLPPEKPKLTRPLF